MTHPLSLRQQIALHFEPSPSAEPMADILANLSAIAFTPDGGLWLGADEGTALHYLRPQPDGSYRHQQALDLSPLLGGLIPDQEIDIEGLDYADGYLWLVGSHSTKRSKPKGLDAQSKTQSLDTIAEDIAKDLERLGDVRLEANRFILARLPVGLPGTQPIGLLQLHKHTNQLHQALRQDPHLKPFIKAEIPGKDNGLDVEGLAVQGDRVFLGLRGPVLRGWAIALELQLQPLDSPQSKAQSKTQTKAQSKTKTKTKTQSQPMAPVQAAPLQALTLVSYRKHFLNLGGLGIRDLCLVGDDLLILAGPTMVLDGAIRLFRLPGGLPSGQGDTLLPTPECLGDIPYGPGCDRAEGITLTPAGSLLVVYDSPKRDRYLSPHSLWADEFAL